MQADTLDASAALLDTTAINARLAPGHDNPLRRRVGTFRVQDGISIRGFERRITQAGNAFVAMMEKEGWVLKSRLALTGPFAARDLLTNALLLDEHEYRYTGIFATRPHPVRIELPPALVRQDLQQSLTLRDALKAG